MVKHLITEISEEDFRKLDLVVYRYQTIEDDSGRRYGRVALKMNDILDNEIKITLDRGYETDREDLTLPVTVAIHEDVGYYLDKYMNRFTGAQTYQLGWGIKHLYSTRDYYEARGDYWKVRKDETKVIYRVILDKKWLDSFFLKHYSKTVRVISGTQWIDTVFEWNEQTKRHEPSHSVLVTKNEYSVSYEPIDLVLK